MKKTDIELFKAVSEVLKNTVKSISIIPHTSPDGDAIGSAIGLANTLINAGFKATIISPNDYPEYYEWFESKAEILFYNKNKKKVKETIADTGLLFCVDFNEITRSGKLEKVIDGFTGPKILIDHHPFPSKFCDFVISDTTYSSTAELIFDVVNELGYTEFITKDVAEALFAGIMTDTGSFNHNISDPNTFKVVSNLLQYGINADAIKANIYDNFSASRMQLLGYCLNEKMVVMPEYRAAYINLSKKELKKYNFTPGDTEGFVNYPLSIKGVVFSVLFIEKDDYVKASFRSKGSFPANRFSSENFNGGGHLNAAGGESKLGLDETIEKFKQLLPDYLHQLLNA